jgi:hypothetical protein
MRRIAKGRSFFVWLVSTFYPAAAAADAAPSSSVASVGSTGVSGLWVLANISYAGMRAQGSPSEGWRIAAFILGFPGTLVSYFVVDEGRCRAYGIHLSPRHRD